MAHMAAVKSVKSNARRVLLVDDHPIVSEGLAEILNRQPDLKVCGCCHSGNQVLPEIKRLSPEVMVIDIGLGGVNGIDLIKQVRAFHEKLPIVVLSMHDERLYAERALKAGALGYVMKQAPVDQVIEAVRQALSGQRYLSGRMQERLMQMFGNTAISKPGVDRLTDREIEVFALLGSGANTRDIAKKLNISTKTVETYRANIKEKLGLRTASEILRAALEFTQEHVH